MRFATGYAFRLRDLFIKFPFEKLKFDGGSFQEIFKTKERCIICARILAYSLKLIVTDIIKNNVTFILPTNSKYAELYVRRTSQEEFAKIRQAGYDQDVDFLETNFTTYRLSFRWQGRNLLRQKPCYMSLSLKKLMIENMNNGMKYC